jgi:integrase
MKLKLTATAIDKVKVPNHGERIEICDTEMPGLRLRVTQAAKTYFVLYRNTEGRRQRYQIGDATITPSEARKAAKAVLADVAKGKDPSQEKRSTKKAETLRQFLDVSYGPWLKANRKSAENPLQRLKTAFEPFLDRKLSAVTPWAIEKGVAEGRKEKNRPAYRNRDLACLKSALNKAVAWHLIESNPLAGVRLAKIDTNKQLRILSADEEKRLMDALDARDRDKRAARRRYNIWCKARHLPELPSFDDVAYPDHATPMVLLSLHTGIRRGEMFNLEWRDVDLRGATLAVRGEVAKSGHTRIIPLNATALTALKAWKEQSSPDAVLVFPSPDTGTRFDNIKRLWDSICDAAKLDGIRWHDLRHSFASRLLSRGASIETVRTLLGHVDIKTTSIYLHSGEDEQRQAVDRLAANGA